jgi:agmatinase
MKNLQKIVSSPFCYKFNDSDICLLSIPYDSGDLERVGCRLGPDEVKKSLWLLYGYDAQTKKSMFDKKVCDLGDVRVCTGYFEETRRRVKGVVKKLKDKIPILLLGEHTMTAVALEEVNARHVVVFDAHLDMWDKYDNFKWSPACTVRRIIDLGKKVTMVGTRDVSE